MKKRTLSIILLLIFALSILLPGCGAETTATEPQKTEQTDPTAAVSAQTEEEQTLTVWCWDPNYNIYAMNVAEEIYRQEHPNFHLEVIETNQQDLMQKLATSATSGQFEALPDIILVQDAYFPMFLASYPDAFSDLTDYGFRYEEFSANKVGFSTADGRQYGVPFDSGTAIAC